MISKQHMEAKGLYMERYDSFYDPIKDKWLERKCSDKTCEFCKDRPHRPTEQWVDDSKEALSKLKRRDANQKDSEVKKNG